MNKHLVVLPNYCCNEFVKALLLAGCQPLFVEVDDDGVLDLCCLEDLFRKRSSEILCVLAANNTGRNCDLHQLNELCQLFGILWIEDAGYSIGGKLDTCYYGTFSSIVIVNLSEGKMIPIGGGLLITTDYYWNCLQLDTLTRRGSLSDFMKELFSLGIYYFGSSNIFYSVYVWIKRNIGMDLKRRLSNETSRRNEDYEGGNIVFCEKGYYQLTEEYGKSLVNMRMTTFTLIKRLWLNWSYISLFSRIKRRRALYNMYTESLSDKFWLMCYLSDDVIVKVPILLENCDEDLLRELFCLGVSKQYSRKWSYCNATEFPNSAKHFTWQYCLPVHEGVSPGRVRQIISLLLTA
jgi:dTDP-4-amino-4,6-dideoxygalactose transaminase